MASLRVYPSTFHAEFLSLARVLKKVERALKFTKVHECDPLRDKLNVVWCKEFTYWPVAVFRCCISAMNGNPPKVVVHFPRIPHRRERHGDE